MIDTIIYFILISGIIVWIIFLYFSYYAYKNLKPLDSFIRKELKKNTNCPSISVVIAVKDEEKRIHDTLNKLLNSKYPNIEVIVVNDRSNDRTESIIDSMIKTNPQLLSINIKYLPTNWLGKVNALAQGYKMATSKFVLFTDGDVEINSEVLFKSVLLMEEKKLDHLTIMPYIPCPTFLLDLLVLTSQLLFTLSNRPWLRIEERPLKCIKGIGPFNLVRKDFFDSTEGFEWLKLDISDDVALSHLIAKNNGRSLYIQAGKDGPFFPWYSNGREMIHGLEKNIVGGFTNYKLSLLIIVSLFSFLPTILFLIAVFHITIISNFLAAVFLLSNLIFAFKVRKFIHHPTHMLLLYPFGIALLAIVMLRAAYICYKNGGIYWSGTFYSLEKLRSGVRVKLGL